MDPNLKACIALLLDLEVEFHDLEHHDQCIDEQKRTGAFDYGDKHIDTYLQAKIDSTRELLTQLLLIPEVQKEFTDESIMGPANRNRVEYDQSLG
jgi:hypothetical protein